MARKPARAALIVSLAFAAAGARWACAQTSGASFAEARFAQTVVGGEAAFAGSRVHTWTEGGVRRLVLSGDVRVTLGEHRFHARRAAAWLVDVPNGAGGTATQAFVIMEGVGDAEAPAGSMPVGAGALPVRAVVDTGGRVRVTADLLIEHAPGEGATKAERAVLAAGEEALAKSLARQAGRGEPEVPRALPAYTPKRYVELPPKPAVVARPKPIPKPAPTPKQPPERREARGPTPAPARTSTIPPPSRVATAPVQPPAPGRRVQPEGAPVSEGPSAPEKTVPESESTPAAERRATQEPLAERGGTQPLAERGGTQETATQEQPAQATGDPIFAKDGIVTLSPGNVTFIPGEDENAVLVTGGVTVQYTDIATDRTLQLTAQRGVVFVDPGRLEDMVHISADKVRGIFLEGNVIATDGTYTLRGPEVYYDLRANKAVMLDAVFWTYDELRRLPIYVRAKAIRQTSATTFTGEKAKFTTSAFFDPELAIGASKVTISRQQAPIERAALDERTPRGTRTTTWVEARNITGRLAGLPVFYFPRYAGDPENRLIKDVRFENKSGSGGAILTTFNAYALLGMKAPRQVKADILADFYFERGIALGADASWIGDKQEGAFFAYMVPFDRGEDVMKSGARIQRDNEFRGILTGEQRWRVDEHWTVVGEAAYLSDEAVVDGFFDDLGETRREFTNRLAARRLKEHTAFTAEVKGALNDFIANEYLLTSQGYSVTKTPEFAYARHADDLLHEVAPGLLTWFSEYRVGRMEMAFDEKTAAEHGFLFNTLSQRALGLNFDERISDALRARGFIEEPVYRADTRQELVLHKMLGPVTVNPFVVGRATAYDNTFEAYSPDEDEFVRLWGAAGVRISTTVNRVSDTADSRLFDIHRLRHIVEPNATVWVAGANMDRTDLPVYDADVEDLADGAMIRVGVNQTIQTQRGGPGRWHSVDLFTLSTDFVSSNDQATPKSPIGRFFDYRPEYSNPGDYFVADATLRLTDATSLFGGTVYDLEESEQTATNVGFMVRHYPDFNASVEVRYLMPQDTTYVNMGLGYDLTTKYSIGFGGAYDTDEKQFQTASVEVRRKFSSLMFGIGISVNEITNETGLSFSFRPYGVTGSFGFSGLGGTEMGSRLGGD